MDYIRQAHHQDRRENLLIAAAVILSCFLFLFCMHRALKKSPGFRRLVQRIMKPRDYASLGEVEVEMEGFHPSS